MSLFDHVIAALLVASTVANSLRLPDLILPGVSWSQHADEHPALQALSDNSTVQNSRPLIGILSQACYTCPGKSYVSAGYVKWLEAAGGRAVPIRFYESEDELKRLFQSVNGLLLPGGLTDLWLDDPYVLAANKLYKWAKEENDAGRTFPVWGTCLGHQLQMIMTANVDFNDLLVPTDAVSNPNTLEFTDAAEKALGFRDMAPDLLKKLGDPSQNIAMENHQFGVPPSHFDRWPVLKDDFIIISTTKDRNGTEYISTIEHKKYPFFGTQWHPEKPPTEFSDRTIPHSLDAVRVSQHLANVFVHLARRSPHKPESIEQELEDVIYNYHCTYTARDSVFEASYDGPDNTYFFDPPEVESGLNRVMQVKAGNFI